MALKENYKDDILDVSVNTKRKYRMTENPDGTVSFDDETTYTQEGDSFGASDMNATNGKVNTLESDIGEINDNLNGFKFYPTGTQLVAYIEGHGWYNADGKYVIWGTATANALVEASPNTYYGRQSEEDCRGEVGADTASPFRKNANFIQIADSEITSYTITQNDVDNYKQLIIIGQSSTGGGSSISMSATNVDISFTSYNSHSQTTSGVGVFVRNNLVVGDTITVNKGNGMYLKLMVLGVKY